MIEDFVINFLTIMGAFFAGGFFEREFGWYSSLREVWRKLFSVK